MPIFYKIEPKVKDWETYVPSSTLSLLEALTTKMPTSRPYVAPIMIPGTNCPDGTAVPYVTSASKKNVTCTDQHKKFIPLFLTLLLKN